MQHQGSHLLTSTCLQLKHPKTAWVLRKHCMNCSSWYCKRWSCLKKPISFPPPVFQLLGTPSEVSGRRVLRHRCPLAAVGLPDAAAIVVSPRAFKMESGNYFISIRFPLEMNQDQDKPLYLQRRACRDSKRREDALTGVCFCIFSPSAEQGLLSCCIAPCPSSRVDTIHWRL